MDATAEGLTKRYGDVVALDHLDLEVSRGEVVGFLGPNGAGQAAGPARPVTAGGRSRPHQR